MAGYFCNTCGKHHDSVPLSYALQFPESWYAVPEHERERRCVLGDEQCIIDNQYFFIRGNIDIPILGRTDHFAWTVWVSLSKQNFERAGDLWSNPKRIHEPPYFGWLNSRIHCYPDTCHLKTEVHTRKIGVRPFVELEPTDHPLAVEQRNGISWNRVLQIAELVLHQGGTQSHG